MRRSAAIAAIALLACMACAGGSEVSGDRRIVGSVTLTFTVTPARVQAGHTVEIAFHVTNIAGKAASLTFPSGQKYDYWVTRDGREVWRWSSGRAFTQQVVTQELQPQTPAIFTERWRPDASGAYVAHGELKAQGYAGAMSGDLTVQ